MGYRESLRGIVEIVEHDGITPVEVARQARLSSFKQEALGPPDLVIVTKSWSSPAPRVNIGWATGEETQARTSYHFVSGLDTSSSASICSYLGQILKYGLEKCSHYSWNVSCDHGWKIASIVYRTYLALRKCDLVATILVPGAPKFHLVDYEGNEAPVDDNDEELWAEAHVCSSLRLLKQAGLYPAYPCIRTNISSTLLVDRQAEYRYLESAFKIIQYWYKAGSDIDPPHVIDRNSGVRASRNGPPASCFIATSRIASYLTDSLFELCRFQDVVDLFSAVEATRQELIEMEQEQQESGQLTDGSGTVMIRKQRSVMGSFTTLRKKYKYFKRYPDLAIYAAMAKEQMGDLKGSLEEIQNVIRVIPESPFAKQYLAHFITRHKVWYEKHASGYTPSAVSLLEEILALPGYTSSLRVCISYADVVLRDSSLDAETRIAKALVALNNGHMEPPVLDGFIRDIIKGRKHMTDPDESFAAGSNIERICADRVRAERAGLFNKGRRKPSKALAELPGRLMTKEESEVYSKLVQVVNEIGWEQFLSLRRTCFLMADELQSDENPIETAKSKGKAVCQPWLDFLISSLFEDLNRYLGWIEEDKKLVAADLLKKQEEAAAATGGTMNTASASAQPPPSASNEDPGMERQVSSTDPDAALHDADRASGSNLNADPRMQSRHEFDTELTPDAPVESDLAKRKSAVTGSVAGEDAKAENKGGNGAGASGESEAGDGDGAAAGATAMGDRANSTNTEQQQEENVRKIKTMGLGAKDIKFDDTASIEMDRVSQIVEINKRAAVDWLRRAELGRRLQHFEDAKYAWRVCARSSVKIDQEECMTAYTVLIEMYKNEPSSIRQLFRACDLLWSMYEHLSGWNLVYQDASKIQSAHFANMELSQTDNSWNLAIAAPPLISIRKAVYAMISLVGLNMARHELKQVAFSDPRKMHRLEMIMLDGVWARVYGYDQ